MHPVAERNSSRALAIADRRFGDRLVGFYLVGSVALDRFRPERSDIDFVAVVDDPQRDDCRRVRSVQVRSGLRTGAVALARGQWSLPGTCNGAWVPRDQLARPVTEIEPIAGHAGQSFSCGSAFDVNPVQWQTLRTRGIALRGPAPGDLGLDPEPGRLRQWNLDNLRTYWEPLAVRLARGDRIRGVLGPKRWLTAWVVLGVPRLHHTIATGSVIGKEDAGIYALATFDERWQPIVEEALAYWRGETVADGFDETTRRQAAGEFALEVIRDAARLP